MSTKRAKFTLIKEYKPCLKKYLAFSELLSNTMYLIKCKLAAVSVLISIPTSIPPNSAILKLHICSIAAILQLLLRTKEVKENPFFIKASANFET